MRAVWLQWDVLSDTRACEVVSAHLQRAAATAAAAAAAAALLPGAAPPLPKPLKLTPALADAAAGELVEVAMASGTMDNVTAVVALLPWG